MKKAYELSEKIVNEVNYHVENFKTETFKDVPTSDMITSLNKIIKDGLVLYKYLQENKLYEGKDLVTADMLELSKYVNKLQMTKANAKKLDLKNALQLWDQTMLIIANLACDLLDYRDSVN